MAWSTALSELRTLLADTAADNLIKEQAALGVTNGQNTIFYTFQDRLVASGNQAMATTPLHAWVNNVEVAASGILVSDAIRGQFELLYTTVSGSTSVGSPRVKCSYHFQQSLDGELNFFLTQASNLVSVSDVTTTAAGLQQAVLYLAASAAHTRLAQRWQLRKSEQFMVQDEPMRKEAEDLIRFHQQESKRCYEMGMDLRQQFYEFRQDRGRAPAFGVLKRPPLPWTPRR